MILYDESMKKRWILLISLLLLLSACRIEMVPAQTETAPAPTAAQTPQEVADFLREHGALPDYYLTKQEARERGWVAEKGNLWEVAEGCVIGGDRFGNREGLLPEKDHRQYYEADVNYKGGHRGSERLVFSDDGLIFYTDDHYDSFSDWTEESP